MLTAERKIPIAEPHEQSQLLRGDRSELELTIDGGKQIAGPGITRPVSFAWPVEPE